VNPPPEKVLKKPPSLIAGVLMAFVGLNFIQKGINTIHTGVWLPGQKSSPITGYEALGAGIILLVWGLGSLIVRWKIRLRGGR
jgi:hypothetical protein